MIKYMSAKFTRFITFYNFILEFLHNIYAINVTYLLIGNYIIFLDGLSI